MVLMLAEIMNSSRVLSSASMIMQVGCFSSGFLCNLYKFYYSNSCTVKLTCVFFCLWSSLISSLHTYTVKERKKKRGKEVWGEERGRENGWKDLLAQQVTDAWVAAMLCIFTNSSHQSRFGFLLKRQRHFLISSYLRTTEKYVLLIFLN